ncbi:MAG: transcriptional repressor LexA [Oligoflexia bacterium]|nr:transcriptional repressor LexA [Oligoflexia bacterium]
MDQSGDGKLSAKQAEVLRVIQEGITREGRPPTYRDIARSCGYEAVGTVQDHVRALIRKGYLRKEPGVARGLQLSHRSESTDVPILGAVPAGHPLEAIESAHGSLAAPSRLKGPLFALKVKGESMIEAGILDGDYVIVRKQEDAQNGEIVVALIDGEATVKFLEKKRGRIRLLPANPRFSPIELGPGSENLIQGKVVSVQRYYSTLD